MARIVLTRSNIAAIDGQSNINVSVTPEGFSSGTLQEVSNNVGEGTYVIVAGAYVVDIVCAGVKNITVIDNGGTRTLSPGQHWHSSNQVNKESKIQDFVGAVQVIVPEGAKAWYKAIYPSV